MPIVRTKYCSICGEETKIFTYENHLVDMDNMGKIPDLIAQVYIKQYPGSNKEKKIELDICPLCSSIIITEINKRIKQKREKEIQDVINERKSK